MTRALFYLSKREKKEKVTATNQPRIFIDANPWPSSQVASSLLRQHAQN